jgi:hypothetical protein
LEARKVWEAAEGAAPELPKLEFPDHAWSCAVMNRTCALPFSVCLERALGREIS